MVARPPSRLPCGLAVANVKATRTSKPSAACQRCAASGQAAVALPKNGMNSHRRIRPAQPTWGYGPTTPNEDTSIMEFLAFLNGQCHWGPGSGGFGGGMQAATTFRNGI